MSREEWLLAEEIKTELALCSDALSRLDELERKRPLSAVLSAVEN